MERIVIPYKPRDQFRSFHARKQRWGCIVAHRRCGKTVACINDLIKRALTDGKEEGRYAYIAPFHNQAKSVAWDYLLKYSDPVRTRLNAAELWVELINGARVRLFGADLPDALRGLYMDGVILDEYADMKPRVWGEIIRPLLSDRQGWAVFIGTPKGHNAFYDIYREARDDDDWMTLTLRASDTDLLPAVELDDARRGMTEGQYAQEFECSFEAAILGSFYGREMADAESEGRVSVVDHDPALPTFTAWDLGYRDDTAIWWYQVLRDEIHVIDYHASSGADISFYAGLVLGKPYKYAKHHLPHDARAKTLSAAGKSILEQLAGALGMNTLAIVPELSVQDGIQAARMALPRCWFDADKCREGVEALKQYQREWDEDKKAFRERPRHDWTSHPSDAFRMMAVAWKALKPEAPKVDIIPRGPATIDQMIEFAERGQRETHARI